MEQAILIMTTIICWLSRLLVHFFHFVSKSNTWRASKYQICVHTYFIRGIAAHYLQEAFLSPGSNEFTSQTHSLQHLQSDFLRTTQRKSLSSKVNLICSGTSASVHCLLPFSQSGQAFLDGKWPEKARTVLGGPRTCDWGQLLTACAVTGQVLWGTDKVNLLNLWLH